MVTEFTGVGWGGGRVAVAKFSSGWGSQSCLKTSGELGKSIDYFFKKVFFKRFIIHTHMCLCVHIYISP